MGCLRAASRWQAQQTRAYFLPLQLGPNIASAAPSSDTGTEKDTSSSPPSSARASSPALSDNDRVTRPTNDTVAYSSPTSVEAKSVETKHVPPSSSSTKASDANASPSPNSKLADDLAPADGNSPFSSLMTRSTDEPAPCAIKGPKDVAPVLITRDTEATTSPPYCSTRTADTAESTLSTTRPSDDAPLSHFATEFDASSFLPSLMTSPVNDNRSRSRSRSRSQSQSQSSCARAEGSTTPSEPLTKASPLNTTAITELSIASLSSKKSDVDDKPVHPKPYFYFATLGDLPDFNSLPDKSRETSLAFIDAFHELKGRLVKKIKRTPEEWYEDLVQRCQANANTPVPAPFASDYWGELNRRCAKIPESDPKDYEMWRRIMACMTVSPLTAPSFVERFQRDMEYNCNVKNPGTISGMYWRNRDDIILCRCDDGYRMFDQEFERSALITKDDREYYYMVVTRQVKHPGTWVQYVFESSDDSDEEAWDGESEDSEDGIKDGSRPKASGLL